MKAGVLLLLGVVPLLTACGGGQEARVAARVVLAETLQYERLVNRKIDAEEAYYANRAQSLNEGLDRALKIGTAINIVATSARTSDVIVKRGTAVTSVDVSDFIVVVLRSQDDVFEGISQKRQELRTLVTESLEPLQLDKAALQRTRKALEALQISPDEKTRLRSLYEFIDATRAEYKKLREAEK
jgi:hypothetical protein